MKVSWDDEIPNIWKNIPNHQPAGRGLEGFTCLQFGLSSILPCPSLDSLRLIH
jgi:hypothetical protein